jgi:hypothetical protein
MARTKSVAPEALASLGAEALAQVLIAHAETDLIADSDESSRRFRLKPATCSDGSQPVIPTKPAGVAERTASLVNGVSLR